MEITASEYIEPRLFYCTANLTIVIIQIVEVYSQTIDAIWTWTADKVPLLAYSFKVQNYLDTIQTEEVNAN